MDLGDKISKWQDEEKAEADAKFVRRLSKQKAYVFGLDCPSCGRRRVMVGQDGKYRCEKCAWCIQDEEYDDDLL